ncbi:MAG: branched-chain amino acid transaminase [Chloroflexota bacterium]
MSDAGNQTYAYFEGDFVPLEDAKVSVMTHAFNYGTGVFEGIRGYWSADDQVVYVFRLREHYERFLKNTRMVCINVSFTADDLVAMTLDLLGKDNFSRDVYIRPLAYKSSKQIGVSMKGVADDLTIFAVPMGDYVPIDRGLSVMVSSWRRTPDNSIPVRAKITGNYANAALAKNEAVMNGYDEAIVLNDKGFAVEGSAENLFMVRRGELVTPTLADDILEGITRDTVIELAENELGIKTVQRQIARSELYYADEVFLTGTGGQLAGVISVDQRSVGDGKVGPISTRLQQIYFDVVKGHMPKYHDWLTPVAYHAAGRQQAVVS